MRGKWVRYVAMGVALLMAVVMEEVTLSSVLTGTNASL